MLFLEVFIYSDSPEVSYWSIYKTFQRTRVVAFYGCLSQKVASVLSSPVASRVRPTDTVSDSLGPVAD